MSTYFRPSRNIELSLLYYLEDNLSTDWSGVSVVKTFADVYTKDNVTPIVCVRLADATNPRLEVGSDTLDPRYLLVIDVFARSDAQRLDLADYIKDKLKDGWVHYDHAHVSGDKTQLERTANGRDYVTEFITDAKLDFIETVDVRDKYRHNISIRVRNNTGS